MSTCKSSTVMGTLAEKSTNWMKVPDEELATDIDNSDLAEEEEKCWKEEAKHQRETEAEQKWEAEKRRQATAAEARKWQCADSEAQVCKAGAYVPHTNGGQEMFGVTATSPRGGQKKKWVRKMANEDNDDDEIVILSGQKTGWQGGSESLEEITDRQWGELIQAVSSHMDIANGHLEKIVSMAQSNGQKMQQHHLLMEGLVGQQQLLVLKLVEMLGATRSGGATGVAEGQEELQELQREGSGGQEGKTEGVSGGAPEGELEDKLENLLGNEPGNGAGAEDGTEEEAQKDRGKGKEKAL
ncbi:hypothetical protein ID866_12046 [Astraeus odoratus]|nr:hypothetical protein ID866_12046 [Astraeus odoratus]